MRRACGSCANHLLAHQEVAKGMVRIRNIDAPAIALGMRNIATACKGSLTNGILYWMAAVVFPQASKGRLPTSRRRQRLGLVAGCAIGIKVERHARRSR